jgi:S1-C subfamily serine protease
VRETYNFSFPANVAAKMNEYLPKLARPLFSLLCGLVLFGGAIALADQVTSPQSIKVEELRKQAAQGDAHSQYVLGYCYRFGNGDGIPQNHAAAVEWLRKAAEQGIASAQYYLGEHLYHGEGVDKNYTEAVKWYREAAKKKDPPASEPSTFPREQAAYMLGLCYENGNGVPKDLAEAFRLYESAYKAYDPNPDVAYALGKFYAHGWGVPKNNSKAWDYLIKAEWKYPDAKRLREKITAEMEAAQVARKASEVASSPPLPSGASDAPSSGAQEAPPSTEPSATPSSKGMGTAFFITRTGYLVTNYHVVKGAKGINIVSSAGKLEAQLVRIDEGSDLALLKVSGKFDALPVTSSRKVRLGASVVTVGFPNPALQGFSPKFAKGEIGSLAGIQDDAREFQISVPVQPGNSGGALVDQRGNVVGVVVAALNQKAALETSGALAQNVNYAIKSSYLLSLLESTPDVTADLLDEMPQDQPIEDVVEQVKKATVLVAVY